MARPESIESPRRISRVRKACEACRKRKDKCDGRTPCQNCTSRAISCLYGLPLKKRGLPQGYTKSLERRIHLLETTLREITSKSSAMTTEYNSLIQGFSDGTADSIERLYEAHPIDESDVPGDLSSIITPEAASRGFVSQSPASSIANSSVIEEQASSKIATDLLPETRALLSTDENSVIRCVGLASGLHLVTSGEKVDDSLRRADESVQSESFRAPKIGSTPDIDVYLAQLPPLAIQHKVFDKFFAETHHYMVFIDREMVNGIAEYLTSSASNRSQLVLPHLSTHHRSRERAALLLFTVLAVGISHLDEPIDGLDMSDRYHSLVMELLFRLRDHVTIEMVQALLVLTWKEEGCDRLQQAWLHIGHAIRIAKDLGLDRSCQHWMFMDEREKRVRQTTWWSCYTADSTISLRLGRSPTIREDDYDVPFPQTSISDNVAWRVFVHVIKLCQIINRIILEFYPVRKQSKNIISSRRMRDHFHGQLQEWQNRLPSDLGLPPRNGGPPAHPVLTMHLLFHTILLILHRPFISGIEGHDSDENYRSSALTSSFILASYRYTSTGLRSNPFIVYFAFTSAIALIYSSQSSELSISEPAKFGLQECFSAFRAMERTWHVATHAMNLIASNFDIDNIFTHSKGHVAISSSEFNGGQESPSQARRKLLEIHVGSEGGECGGDLFTDDLMFDFEALQPWDGIGTWMVDVPTSKYGLGTLEDLYGLRDGPSTFD